uniref:Guanylyl cyclase n=1 Tax=Amphora coffeiformis TaxID=265554 RepID=A0A7S3KYU9_9STRA
MSYSDNTMVRSFPWWQSIWEHFDAVTGLSDANNNHAEISVDARDNDGSSPSPRQKEDVIHVLQQADWDCGIACLLMIWSWLAQKRPNREAIDEQRRSLLDLVDTKSIWTIDLVYALHNMAQRPGEITTPFDFLFCSAIFEANAEWKDYSYYSEAFDRDEKRTQERLHRIQKERPSCLQQTKEPPSIHWVIEQIQDTCTMAILLIDNATLASCMESEPSCRHYAGHYLLISGVCMTHQLDEKDDGKDPSSLGGNEDLFLMVFNPNSSRVGVDYILARHVEVAWKAQGTDQDVIFVRKMND